MPHRLAQQRMTLSDRERPFHASRAISAIAELLVILRSITTMTVIMFWLEQTTLA